MGVHNVGRDDPRKIDAMEKNLGYVDNGQAKNRQTKTLQKPVIVIQ